MTFVHRPPKKNRGLDLVRVETVQSTVLRAIEILDKCRACVLQNTCVFQLCKTITLVNL